jgi:hypothetical protein
LRQFGTTHRWTLAPRRCPQQDGEGLSPISTHGEDAQHAGDDLHEISEVADRRSRGLTGLSLPKWIAISGGFGEAFSLGVNFAPLHLPWFADVAVMLGAPSVSILVAAYAYKIMRAIDRDYRHREHEDHIRLIETLGRLGPLTYTHDRDQGRENVDFRRQGSDGPAAGERRAPDRDEHRHAEPAPAEPRDDLHAGTPDPPRRDGTGRRPPSPEPC